MAKITFIEPSGDEHVVEAQPGMSVMEAATRNGVAGIIAECGGNCACGTCRIYVEGNWKTTLAKPGELEQSMIDFIEDDNPDLRLSCQIDVSDELEGLVVRVSPEQH